MFLSMHAGERVMESAPAVRRYSPPTVLSDPELWRQRAVERDVLAEG
jgi:hypothetical protein